MLDGKHSKLESWQFAGCSASPRIAGLLSTMRARAQEWPMLQPIPVNSMPIPCEFHAKVNANANPVPIRNRILERKASRPAGTGRGEERNAQRAMCASRKPDQTRADPPWLSRPLRHLHLHSTSDSDSCRTDEKGFLGAGGWRSLGGGGKGGRGE